MICSIEHGYTVKLLISAHEYQNFKYPNISKTVFSECQPTNELKMTKAVEKHFY